MLVSGRLYKMEMTFLNIVIFSSCLAVVIEGHGYMLKPPARGTAWRAGFKTPADYNDMGNYCGGKGVQHSSKNGGRCGVCGEEFSNPSKKNEPGPANKFATGKIVANYKQGQTIDVTIMATAFHLGYYEFRLCENNIPQKGKDASIAVTNECLNKNLLTTESGGTRFKAAPLKTTHRVKLPDTVSCSACVFQWRYRTGNNWGCENGKCGSGMGSQEEFVGCADVAIASNGGAPPANQAKPVLNVVPPKPSLPVQKQPAVQKPISPKGNVGTKVCHGKAPYGAQLDSFCNSNCNAATPYCPSTHCTCNA